MFEEKVFKVNKNKIGLSRTVGPIASYTGEIYQNGWEKYEVYPQYVIQIHYQCGSLEERSDLILVDFNNKKISVFGRNWCMDYLKYPRDTEKEEWVKEIKGNCYDLEIDFLEEEGFEVVNIEYFTKKQCSDEKKKKHNTKLSNNIC